MRNSFARVALSLLVSLSFCQAQQQMGNSIHGTVSDVETGKPIDQFRVTKGTVPLLPNGGTRGAARFGPETSTTFRDGKYDFPFPARIPSSGGGAFVLRFEAEGYLPELSPPVRATPLGIADTTFHIKLRKATPLIGTIQSPDGMAAAGAEVFLVSQELPLFLENNRVKSSPVRAPQAGVRSVTSAADGAFSIARDTPGSILLVMHETGAVIIKDPAALVDGMTVLLDKWGQITAVARNSDQPLGGQVAGLTIEASEVRSMPIGLEYTATANADGQFVFERVFPRAYAIERIAPDVRQGLIMQELASYAPVVIAEAGKTTNVDLGSKGRTITGKAAIDGDKQPRTLAPVAVRIYTRRGNPKTPAEMQAWLVSRRVYDAQLKPDGSFSLDSIEPGEYTMLLRGVADAVPDPRLGNRPAIRDYVAEITVPPAPAAGQTEVMDLGQVTFRIPVTGQFGP